MMRKSVHTKNYSIFLDLLIEVRHRAGMTQAQLGRQLPFGQPGISKIERAERRVDVIELRIICEQLGTTLSAFVAELKKRLEQENA